jgi:hypothetical protein
MQQTGKRLDVRLRVMLERIAASASADCRTTVRIRKQCGDEFVQRVLTPRQGAEPAAAQQEIRVDA